MVLEVKETKPDGLEQSMLKLREEDMSEGLEDLAK